MNTADAVKALDDAKKILDTSAQTNRNLFDAVKYPAPAQNKHHSLIST
jgi:hypothetical protein